MEEVYREVMEELAEEFDVDIEDEQQVRNIPKAMQGMRRALEAPKFVTAFMLDTGTGQMSFALPEVERMDEQMFSILRRACQEAAEKYSEMRWQLVAGQADKVKPEEIEEE